MDKTTIYKRLYKDYSKKYLNKIIIAAFFSILVAGSTSAEVLPATRIEKKAAIIILFKYFLE